MRRIILIITPLIFSISLSYSQSQKEALRSFNEKGKTYFSTELDFIMNFTSIRNRGAVLSLTPKIGVHHNVLDRLSIGANIKAGTSLSMDLNRNVRSFNSSNNSLGFELSARYYPFKKNGFFVEGAMDNRLFFYKDPRLAELGDKYYSALKFSPGYTFMIGQNKKVALDIKLGLISTTFRGINILDAPSIGLKIPLGKKTAHK